jgi:hypothetical protein
MKNPNGVKLNIFIFLFILMVLKVFPCNVPVFRYALERWTADPYQLNIYYQVPLNEEQVSWLTELKKYSFEGDSTLNLSIQFNDLTQIDFNPFEGLKKDLNYPLMVLSYPKATIIDYPAWYGELSKGSINLLINSPIRKDISERLLKGDAAVWLFLESGDQQQDQHYFNLLRDELSRISDTLKIPTTSIDINGNPIEVGDFRGIKLKFSLMKVSRQDPSEQIFVRMLLGTEFDLIRYQIPLAFPIFGRGRSLYALVGSGLNSNTIKKACQSLVDWCSCEIKALHQGVDLLFFTDWSNRSGGTWVKDEELPPLTGLTSFIPERTDNDSFTKNINKLPLDTGLLRENTNSDTNEMIKSDTLSKTNIFEKTETSSNISRNILVSFLMIAFTVMIISFFIKRKTG